MPLYDTIFDNRLGDKFPQFGHGREVVFGNRLEHSGQTEQPSCIHPFREAVSRGIIQEDIFGNLLYQPLHITQITCPADNFAGFRIPKDKIPKGKLFTDVVAQFDQEGFRIFHDKTNPELLRRCPHALLGGL